MRRRQPYGFGIADTLLAEVGGVPLDALHHDVGAICHCYEAVRPVAKRLGISPPRPRLAGFSYCHVSALGAEILWPPDSEPKPSPIIHSPEDIDKLREPRNYLTSGIVPKRLKTLSKLLERVPDAGKGIGHVYEGPLTTAALLMGQDFFMLPHDDPERAHRLLAFSVRSALNYARAIHRHFGVSNEPRGIGIPDDFAGILSPTVFPEFVLPYWDALYAGLQATSRSLHSELLRKEHLRFLPEVGIGSFDPSADQYLAPETLRDHCPVPFTLRILTWHVRHNSPARLQAMYRYLASFKPISISFHLCKLEEEPKIAALLAVARKLAGETNR